MGYLTTGDQERVDQKPGQAYGGECHCAGQLDQVGAGPSVSSGEAHISSPISDGRCGPHWWAHRFLEHAHESMLLYLQGQQPVALTLAIKASKREEAFMRP